MALHLLNLILITTTTITNFACGEHFLKLPLTTNPILQDAITVRNTTFDLDLFYRLDPTFFSRLTPADIVMSLNSSLAFVMRKTIAGAVILGVAAKEAGLQVEHLKYEPNNKWTVNISLTDIRSILTEREKYLLPLSDNITLTSLQKLGLRVLERRYNVSLGKIADPLHLSKATRFHSIREDWIQVVKFIAKTNVNRLAAIHNVSVSTLAEALGSTSSELYSMTLEQLDGLLSTSFKFVKGSLEVVVPTTVSSTVQSTLGTTTPEQSTLATTTPEQSTLAMTTPVQTAAEVKSTVSFPPTESPTILTLPTSVVTDKAISLPFSTKNTGLKTAGVGRPTEGSSSDGATTNLALFVGVAAGLLLLLVASSTVWCFKRKRRHHSSNIKKNKPKNNNNIKMNNFWIEKNDSELQPNQEESRQEEQVHFVRSPSGSTTGFDSRFKGLKYVATSSTFDPGAPFKINNSTNNFENDSRREIFV